VPHEILVLEHLLHREGEGDGDREGKPFGDGDDEDGDAGDDEAEELRPVDLVVPRLHAALLGVEGVGHAGAEDEDQRDADIHAHRCDEVGHGIKLLLEDAAALLGLFHLLLHGALISELADSHNQHPALARLNERSREQCR